MINRKTIFVLGAGAHCPYGFPDGSGLMKQMIAELPISSEYDASEFSECVLGILQQTTRDTFTKLVDLRRALEFSGHQSIDSFLFTHRKNEIFVNAGRWLIAWLLLPQEFEFKFSRIAPERRPLEEATPDQDWMSYLFRRMLQRSHDSPEAFIENNKVGFVTFNYDRTLEYCLTWKMHHSFPGLSMVDAWEFVKRIPIIHVYGSLGQFDPRSVEFPSDRYPTTIKERASGIRLMYEERDDESALEKFKEVVAGASKVVFLGFGFDPDNIRVLQLTKLLAGVIYNGVMASRYKVPEGEWEAMKHDMQPILIDDRSNVSRFVSRDWDALNFLRESRALE
jgi:hypothetical protein